MIKYLPPVLFALSMISCKSTAVQISTVETKSLNESFEFVNEEIRLTYDFWENGGALKFTIENLTDQPIYIDWAHSNFIFNGYSQDYFTKSQTINSLEVYDFQEVTTLDKVSNRMKNRGVGLATTNTKVIFEKESIQLPPKSYVNSEKIYLDFPWVSDMADYKKAEKSDSPLHLRTYIAYSSDKDLSDLNFIDNEFWIKGFSEMKSNELLNYKDRNKFYTKGIKIDREKTAMAVLAGLVAFLLIIK